MNAGPPSAPPDLELDSVDVPSLAAPDATAISDLTWRVAPGERWLLTGPQGGGKSSVLHVAAGLTRPHRGRYRLFGLDLSVLSEPEQVACRARVGIVFGDGGRLFEHLTVAENLALPLRYHECADAASIRRRTSEILGALELAALADRLPAGLPRRLRHRVSLGRALVRLPELLLLDDPLGLPSPGEEAWWTAFVTGRVAPGLCPATVVLSTTDPRPWREIAGRFACVGAGSWRIAADAAEATEFATLLRPPPGR